MKMIEPPEAIILTLPKMFFEDRGWQYDQFLKYFIRFMRNDDSIWNFRLTNLPVHDVAFVYLVFDGKIQVRVNLVMYERSVTKCFKDAPDKKDRVFEKSNWVILSGPAVLPPHEINKKGFQGFRYSKKIF